ncbi:MAG: carbon storage regulator [Ilumatobacteraceae bacterium]|jgi:carbon storage regulator
MLVLTRREGETFHLGDEIEIEILDIKPGVVRVGIRAPRHVRVLRSELLEAVAAANKGAALNTPIDPGTITVEAKPVSRG